MAVVLLIELLVNCRRSVYIIRTDTTTHPAATKSICRNISGRAWPSLEEPALFALVEALVGLLRERHKKHPHHYVSLAAGLSLLCSHKNARKTRFHCSLSGIVLLASNF